MLVSIIMVGLVSGGAVNLGYLGLLLGFFKWFLILSIDFMIFQISLMFKKCFKFNFKNFI